LVNDYLWIPGLVNIQKNDGKIHHFLAGNVSTISVDLEKYADVFLATNAGELSMNILGV
jgi:hypothetical protein